MNPTPAAHATGDRRGRSEIGTLLTSTERTSVLARWLLRVLVVVVGAGFAVTGALATSAAASAPAQNPVESLVYEIRTVSASGTGACTTSRSVSAVIGVPTLVDVGGSFLPDLLVTVIAVPGVGDGPDLLTQTVVRLGALSLRARIETVVTPSAGEPGRIALGYDGCGSRVPELFIATASSSSTRLAVSVETGLSLPTLGVIGRLTDVVEGQPATTSISAQMTPMPARASLAVDILPSDAYHAELSTSAPTELAIEYVDAVGDASTIATAGVRTFPGRLEVDFDPNSIEYAASRGTTLGGNPIPLLAPIDEVDFAVVTAAPGHRTTELDAELRDVPADGSLARTSDTHVVIDAPEAIGASTVGFASYEPGAPPPALVATGEQYLVADVGLDHAAAQVRVLGLTHVDVDAGDPIVIDLHHTAGPFTLAADVTTRRIAEPGEPPPVPATETRVVDGQVFDLPAEARVEFSPSTQAFGYIGSDEIDELAVRVGSTVPFIDDANIATLLARGVPTGLTGRLDAVGERFDAALLGGTVDLIEVQVTSGHDERLPAGVDGVVVEDHVGTYAAFARITGLRRVDVGWSDAHQYADVDHTAGPFHLRVDTDDTDTEDIDVDGQLLDLPARARFDHVPSQPVACPTNNCETPLLVSFTSDDPDATIGTLTFDVVSGKPLTANATIAHLVASDLPPLSITVDTTGERFLTETTTGGTLGSIGVELCSPTGCGLADLTGPDGAFLTDLDAGGVYQAVVRLNGLRRADVAWGTPVRVDVDHVAGPFSVFVEEDYRVAVPDDPNATDPPSPCVLPTRRACAVVDDGAPTPPGTHLVTHRRSLHATADSLPSTVQLTYDPLIQSLRYTGSAPIGSLEAHFTDGRDLVARARFAHLITEGIPTTLDLAFVFNDDAEVLIADARGATLGHLELELLSDESLLDAVEQSPGFRDGFDGLVYWDLNDFDLIAEEPVDDAFAIAARVTGLQRLDYQRGTSSDGSIAHNRAAVDFRRSGNAAVWIEVQRKESSRPPRVIPGLGLYRAELLNLDYANPPSHLGFEFDERTQGPHNLYRLRYYGSGAGEWARFLSNIGDTGDFTPLIDFTATPVPGGGDSLAAPGVSACIAPSTIDCGDIHEPGFNADELSVSLFVSAPMTLSGVYSGGDSRVTVSDLAVERAIVASTETNNSGVNSTAVYIDTRERTVSGSIREQKMNPGDVVDTRNLVVMPPGFMGFGRHVEMEKEGVGFSRGRVVCPAATLLTHDVFGVDVNLEGRFCPAPRLDEAEAGGVVNPELPPGTHELVVRGTNFVPWIGGATGSRVLLLHNDNTMAFVEADSVEWVDISTMHVTLTIPAGWGTGPHTIRVINPIGPKFDDCECVVLLEP